VVDDALGICAQLERDMAQLVASYRCEWAEVVRDPAKRAAFRHFANTRAADPTVAFTRERRQKRPADWPDAAPPPDPVVSGDGRWVRVAAVGDMPPDGGVTVQVGDVQLAVFHLATRGEWYATQAMCPHRKDMVLGRGLLGTQGDVPKVACPMHKKTFSLETGCGLSDPAYRIQTFPIEVRGGDVFVQVAP
jgi:NAD(P)H-dependent nitrite reductase small subunit